MRDVWERGAEFEVRYWHDWLASQGTAYAHDPVAAHQEFVERFSPHLPLQALYRHLIGERDQLHVDILDVGAGPATTLGKRWPGHDVRIIAIDPLAERYAVWLRHYNLSAPVRTLELSGEELATFDRWHGAFDLTHMFNALDHSLDPLAIVRGMLLCTKPGGVVYLRHHSREAEREQYAGLHQWNFTRDERTMWMETPERAPIDLRAETADLASLFDMRSLPHPIPGQTDDIEVVMRRTSENRHSHE